MRRGATARHARPTTLVAPVALVVAALALAACGVPTGGAPHAITRNQLPAALVGPSAVPATTAVPADNEVPVSIYLLDPSQIPRALSRGIPFPAGLTPVLQALVAGPTQGETLRGYGTAIPRGTRVITASVHDGVATVNLGAPFDQITGAAQVQAVEQVVFTVCGYTTPTTGVQFEVEGQQIEIPIGTGQQVPGPVYLWAYLPGPAHSPTTTAPTTTTTAGA